MIGYKKKKIKKCLREIKFHQSTINGVSEKSLCVNTLPKMQVNAKKNPHVNLIHKHHHLWAKAH